MSPPLKIAKLTPNGEIRTVDIVASIEKRLRFILSRVRDRERPAATLALANRLAKLVKALEAQP